MKKKSVIYFLLAIALSCLLSTPCCAQTGIVKNDSICLSGYEFNYFIGAAYDSHTYKAVIDSLRKMNTRCEMVAAQDSIIKAENKKVVAAKNDVINAQNLSIAELSQKHTEEVDRKKKWRLAALVAIPVALYGNIKNIIIN